MSQLLFLVNIPKVYQTHRPAQLRRWYRPPPKLRPTSKRKLPNPTDAQLHASGPSRLESVTGELVARASHKHALFRDDKASVYHYLEEATRTTAYAASIKPFQRRKDGRGAWPALHGQYAGKDKWEAEIKFQEAVLHTRTWKGQSNFSLESFISQHRNAYVSMEACAEHVQYQFPCQHSRVGFLLDAIQSNDAGLQVASVRTDDGPSGKRNDFEHAATNLLPYDRVAKKRLRETKQGAGMISSVMDIADGCPMKWRQNTKVKPTAKSDGKVKKQSYTKKQLASLVTKRVKHEMDKSSEELKTQDDTKTYIH
jgi:hypothetical protein